jgi:CHAT domain-containing protein
MKLPVKRNQHLYKIIILLLLIITSYACSRVPVPILENAVELQDIKLSEALKITSIPPVKQQLLIAEYSGFDKTSLKIPEIGDKNTYGIIITPELALAFETYLGGDGDKALKVLDQVDPEQKDLKWQISFLKAQILLMMGRAADAEQELTKTSELEISVFGHDLNTTALAGEIKIWLNDFDAAKIDFAKVIKAIGDWELPISYSSFPTNRIDLYSFTTAKLRAYTGLTAIYIFKEEYEKAQLWGKETERLFNNVHFVTNHPLYGAGDILHADSYYGRAMNLAFLASAVLAVEKNFEKSDKLFKTGLKYFEDLNYIPGQIIVKALQARIYNRLEMHDKCYTMGQNAIELAIQRGLEDFVWRIGTLTGKTLLEYGQTAKAEHSFRQAQQSLDLISGSLQTDRAKIRFGVGKEDITYNLAKLDIAKKDWSTLFEDMERGRARAFLEMLADKSIAVERYPLLMDQIKGLEKKIRRLKMMIMAPGIINPDYKTQITGLTNQRKKLLQTLKSKDPDLASFLNVEIASLSKVQSNLNEGETIAYAIPAEKNERIQFLLIEKNSVHFRPLKITYDELQANIDQFVSTFMDYDEDIDSGRGIALINNKKQLEDLGEPTNASFFNQNFNFKKTIKKLYVVPSASLYFMPWGILNTNYPISVLPTGSWLNRKYIQYTNKKITIVGNPIFGNELPQLEGAEQEAKAIGKLYHQQPLIGAKATEKNLRLQIGNGVDILHLATHGVYNYTDPLESSIYLTQKNKAYALTAEHIFKYPLAANKVILSACETGLGKAIAGDDLLGLTRSFFLGGANSVLGSLWAIEDEGTLVFMEAFHKFAKTEETSRAWFMAKNHTQRLGYPPSVYAAFIYYGI